MENTTDTVIGYSATTEPLSEEEAAKQQQKIMELRRYNREYYHAHKKAVGMRALQEDILERQRPEETPGEKPQVQAAAGDGDHREVREV